MLPNNPYTQEPQPPAYEPVRPAVWPWFATYCGVMAFMNFLVMAMGLTIMLIDPALLETGSSTSTTDPVEMKIIGGVYLVMGLPFFLVYLIAPFLPKRPWVWVFDLVLICLGMMSLCCLPVSIPLLLFWLKDETKLFFGKQVPQPLYQ